MGSGVSRISRFGLGNTSRKNFRTGKIREKWIELTDKKVRELNLEQKWRNQAKEHGFDVTGLTTEEIKKMCMARNRELNKLQKLKLEEDMESKDVLEGLDGN